MRDPRVLVAVRERLGLSQEAMAQLLGVSFVSVSRWERGKSSPLQSIVDLYRALDAALANGASPELLVEASRRSRPEFLRFLFNTAYGPQTAR